MGVKLQARSRDAGITTAPGLNRVLWTLWLQGFEKAPRVVDICARSWKIRNPTWTIVQLDQRNLPEYVESEALSEIRSLKISRQKRANLIRMYLISTHGGVWADATCFCCHPLDSWLPDYMGSGFFAFRFAADVWLRDHHHWSLSALVARTEDRVMSNWFLAAEKGNVLTTTFYEEHKQWFLDNRFPVEFTRKRKQRRVNLEGILRRNAKLSQLWTYPPVIRATRLYPYFVFHYHFARLLSENPACRDVWNRTPVLLNYAPRRLGKALTAPVTDEQIAVIAAAEEPLYKLNWRYREDDFAPGCLLDHLASTLPG